MSGSSSRSEQTNNGADVPTDNDRTVNPGANSASSSFRSFSEPANENTPLLHDEQNNVTIAANSSKSANENTPLLSDELKNLQVAANNAARENRMTTNNAHLEAETKRAKQEKWDKRFNILFIAGLIGLSVMTTAICTPFIPSFAASMWLNFAAYTLAALCITSSIPFSKIRITPKGSKEVHKSLPAFLLYLGAIIPMFMGLTPLMGGMLCLTVFAGSVSSFLSINILRKNNHLPGWKAKLGAFTMISVVMLFSFILPSLGVGMGGTFAFLSFGISKLFTGPPALAVLGSFLVGAFPMILLSTAISMKKQIPALIAKVRSKTQPADEKIQGPADVESRNNPYQNQKPVLNSKAAKRVSTTHNPPEGSSNTSSTAEPTTGDVEMQTQSSSSSSSSRRSQPT